MERGGGHPPRPFQSEQVRKPQSQLAGRADAERDGQDLVGTRLL
jgi:hypothetical protein